MPLNDLQNHGDADEFGIPKGFKPGDILPPPVEKQEKEYTGDEDDEDGNEDGEYNGEDENEVEEEQPDENEYEDT